MDYLLTSITEFITPEIISELSGDLKEDEPKVSSAIKSTTASILDTIVNKGDSKKLELILKQAGSYNILLNVSDLFFKESSTKKYRLGSKLLEFQFKEKVKDFYSLISLSSGLKEEKTQKVVSRISTLIAAFLGEQLISGISLSNLIDQIDEGSTDFKGYIPSGLDEILNKNNQKSHIFQKLWSGLF